MPMKNPPIPAILFGLESLNRLASLSRQPPRASGSRPALSSLLNSKADLSAIWRYASKRLSALKMDTLMRMQSAYDIAKTRKRENGNPHPAAFPAQPTFHDSIQQSSTTAMLRKVSSMELCRGSLARSQRGTPLEDHGVLFRYACFAKGLAGGVFQQM